MRKSNENYNKKMGERLKECRVYRGLTQEELAEKTDFSINYISMLECGQRPIDWDKAKYFSEVLNVSPAYIMCESDVMKKNRGYFPLDLGFKDTDKAFITLLELLGYNITFQVIRLYDVAANYCKDNANNLYNNLDNFTINVTLRSLKDINFSEPHCFLSENNTTSEVIIYKVIVNNTSYTFGQFQYLVNKLYKKIDSTLDSFKDNLEEFSLIDMRDNMTINIIKESNASYLLHYSKEKDFVKRLPQDIQKNVSFSSYLDKLNTIGEFFSKLQNGEQISELDLMRYAYNSFTNEEKAIFNKALSKVKSNSNSETLSSDTINLLINYTCLMSGNECYKKSDTNYQDILKMKELVAPNKDDKEFLKAFPQEVQKLINKHKN